MGKLLHINFWYQNQHIYTVEGFLLALVLCSGRAVQQRPINRFSVISFSIRSADSLTDYSGGVKLID